MARNSSTMTSALIVVESKRGTVVVVRSGEGNEVWVCGGSKWSGCGQRSVLQWGMGGRGDGEEQRCWRVIYEAAARPEISGAAFLSLFWRALFWKQILTSFGLDSEKNLRNRQRLAGDSPVTISQWIVRPWIVTPLILDLHSICHTRHPQITWHWLVLCEPYLNLIMTTWRISKVSEKTFHTSLFI